MSTSCTDQSERAVHNDSLGSRNLRAALKAMFMQLRACARLLSYLSSSDFVIFIGHNNEFMISMGLPEATRDSPLTSRDRSILNSQASSALCFAVTYNVKSCVVNLWWVYDWTSKAHRNLSTPKFLIRNMELFTNIGKERCVKGLLSCRRVSYTRVCFSLKGIVARKEATRLKNQNSIQEIIDGSVKENENSWNTILGLKFEVQ